MTCALSDFALWGIQVESELVRLSENNESSMVCLCVYRSSKSHQVPCAMRMIVCVFTSGISRVEASQMNEPM